jgi:hypothetical protein
MLGASRRLAPHNGSAFRSRPPPRPLTPGSPRGARGATATLLPSAAHATKALSSLPGARMTVWAAFPSLRCHWRGLAKPAPRAGPQTIPLPPPARSHGSSPIGIRSSRSRPRAPPGARDQLVAHRRRVVHDTVRITNRLPSPLKHYCPQGRHGCQDTDPPMCCDFVSRWPTLTAAPLARRSTRETFCRNHHGRSAAGVAQP